jgi:hypothetical protein
MALWRFLTIAHLATQNSSSLALLQIRQALTNKEEGARRCGDGLRVALPRQMFDKDLQILTLITITVRGICGL